ncbi:MAG: hypothetical protein Q7S56_03655 [Nanoarchaeota archaeon]|nr:hypothetical protein [Nanoarchaeota archaeon]
MLKKGAFEISFSWLFALIVGAVILFFAIYAASNIIKVGQQATTLQASEDIGILLNPLETGFESASSNFFTTPVETRIYNRCDDNKFDAFGTQGISIQQISFNKWTDTNQGVTFDNKYILSNYSVEGKKFYVFSKPFEFPFKVTDLIYMTSSNDLYCFIDAPEDIKKELDFLGQENLITNCTSEEKQNSIKVCFNGGNCNVNVDINSNFLRKGNDLIYFKGDALMFGAIFSDKDVYECQVKRLMKRVDSLTSLYKDKAALIRSRECNSNVDNELVALQNAARTFEDSKNLNYISSIAENIGDKNDANKQCPLW